MKHRFLNVLNKASVGTGNATQLTVAIADCRRAFWAIAIFSGIFNLLMLSGPMYMLQIYDRVLASRSVPTLVALSVFLVGAYAFQGILDLIRSRIVVRSATLIDHHLGTTIHRAVVKIALTNRNPGEAAQPVRDLDQIRSFLTSQGPIAIVDLPWMIVFLGICFLVHPWIGCLSLAGALVLVAVTLSTEHASRDPSRVLAREAAIRTATIEADRRNSESIVAMGMSGALAQRWSNINGRYINAVERSTDVVGSFGSLTKVLRLLLQSALLGLGAYLVIRNELTAGGMIASSIMMGRALAPIETAIANWRGFVSARQSIARLSEVLVGFEGGAIPLPLPPPERELSVEHVTVAAPGVATATLTDVHFKLSAGEALGIIGPSGAGKTSLVRVLVGIWPLARGTVRIDGAALDQWDPQALGPHVGFVSQAIDLFEGTIAENIARMTAQPDSDAVQQAARAADAHEMILRLPKGYDTPIGESGAVLSAGQRQRIALARALYGAPFLILLDEPHANLDAEGEVALNRSILAAKARGAIVLLIGHKPSALLTCDKVLFLANGAQRAFGPRDEILSKVMPRPQGGLSGPITGANIRIVSDGQAGGDH